jgi:hypothetical protein
MAGSSDPAFFMATGPHGHYSHDVQDLVTQFQDCWRAWELTGRYATRDNMIRLDSLQKAWDALARARRRETGFATYLTPEKYAQATPK